MCNCLHGLGPQTYLIAATVDIRSNKKDSLSTKMVSLNNIIMMHTICCAPEKIYIGRTYKIEKVVLLVR